MYVQYQGLLKRGPLTFYLVLRVMYCQQADRQAGRCSIRN